MDEITIYRYQYEEETNDPNEIALCKKLGPLHRFPDDTRRRISKSGVYEYLLDVDDSGREVRESIRVTLVGWGAKDNHPGQKKELTVKQKIAILRKENQKDNAPKPQFNADGF